MPGSSNPSVVWKYVCDASAAGAACPLGSGTVTFALPPSNGSWQLFYLANDGYTVLASAVIQVQGTATCTPATTPVSSLQHVYARDGMSASKVAFSSCYSPNSVKDDLLWRDVRDRFDRCLPLACACGYLVVHKRCSHEYLTLALCRCCFTGSVRMFGSG